MLIYDITLETSKIVIVITNKIDTSPTNRLAIILIIKNNIHYKLSVFLYFIMHVLYILITPSIKEKCIKIRSVVLKISVILETERQRKAICFTPYSNTKNIQV